MFLIVLKGTAGLLAFGQNYVLVRLEAGDYVSTNLQIEAQRHMIDSNQQ